MLSKWEIGVQATRRRIGDAWKPWCEVFEGVCNNVVGKKEIAQGRGKLKICNFGWEDIGK